jgi:hypothetical protein
LFTFLGVSSGSLTMRLRIGNKYELRPVPIIPLNEAVEHHLHTRHLHYATVDIEGYEYPILRAMQFNGEFNCTSILYQFQLMIYI